MSMESISGNIPLNIKIDAKATAKTVLATDGSGKVVSKGSRVVDRIIFNDLSDADKEHYAFAIKSMTSERPVLSRWEKIRSVVVLNVKTADGEKYVKVNGESIRKRLGMSKEQFKEALGSDHNLTGLMKKIIEKHRETLPTLSETNEFIEQARQRNRAEIRKVPGNETPVLPPEDRIRLEQFYITLVKLHKEAANATIRDRIKVLKTLIECLSLLENQGEFIKLRISEDLQSDDRLSVENAPAKIKEYEAELDKLNDAEFLHNRGIKHLTDDGAITDLAKKDLIRAVKAGSVEAISTLAKHNITYKGELSPQQMAWQGDIEILQGATGATYEMGAEGRIQINSHQRISGDPHAKKAFAFYLQAATQGDLNGIAWSAWCYREGFGVKKDPGKAIEMYMKGANKSLANAQANKSEADWKVAHESYLEALKCTRDMKYSEKRETALNKFEGALLKSLPAEQNKVKVLNGIARLHADLKNYSQAFTLNTQALRTIWDIIIRRATGDIKPEEIIYEAEFYNCVVLLKQLHSHYEDSHKAAEAASWKEFGQAPSVSTAAALIRHIKMVEEDIKYDEEIREKILALKPLFSLTESLSELIRELHSMNFGRHEQMAKTHEQLMRATERRSSGGPPLFGMTFFDGLWDE